MFEYDGVTGYFYLCETIAGEASKILAAIHVFTGEPGFEEEDISIRWDATQSKVGLFVRGEVWAVFDLETGAGHGGAYSCGGLSSVPPEIQRAFELS